MQKSFICTILRVQGELILDNAFTFVYYIPMKTQIRKYIKRKKITASRLATLAGVKRWSVVRYLKQKDADIYLTTAKRLSNYMMRNP